MSEQGSSKSGESSGSKLSTADLEKFTQEAETKLSNESVMKSLKKQFPDIETNPEVRDKVKKRFIADAARKANGGTSRGPGKKSRRGRSEKTSTPDTNATSLSKAPASSRKSSKVKDKGYIPEEESLRHIAEGKKKRQTGVPLSQRGSVRLSGKWSPTGTTTTGKDSSGKEYTMTVRSVPSDTYPDFNESHSQPRTQWSGLSSSPRVNDSSLYSTTADISDRHGFPTRISPLDADLYPWGHGPSNQTFDTWRTGSPNAFSLHNSVPTFSTMQYSPSVEGLSWGPSTGRAYNMHDSGNTMLGTELSGYDNMGGEDFLRDGVHVAGQSFVQGTRTGDYGLDRGNYRDTSHGLGYGALGMTAVSA